MFNPGPPKAGKTLHVLGRDARLGGFHPRIAQHGGGENPQLRRRKDTFTHPSLTLGGNASNCLPGW
jgi:hypothetical protein